MYHEVSDRGDKGDNAQKFNITCWRMPINVCGDRQDDTFLNKWRKGDGSYYGEGRGGVKVGNGEVVTD